MALGSNLGDRLHHLQHAIRLLHAPPRLGVRALSTIVETEPLGDVPQDRYLNCVVELQTSLDPHALLRLLKQLETDLGRQPNAVRWGPRVIDLDLLLYGDTAITTPELTIPHPEMHRRRFVLEPLVQLAPAITHPVLRQTAAALLAALPP